MGLLEDYFSGGGNLNNGQRRDGDATLRELLNQAAFATSGRVIYAVADPVESELEADGSRGRPFGPDQLQDAIDAAEALSPTATNPVTVSIGPGVFDLGSGSLEIHEDQVRIIGSGQEVTIITSTNVVLTVTNASKASLATYRSSGIYSDLVYVPGDPVPLVSVFQSVGFIMAGAGPALEYLGVKGDDTANTTNFLYVGGLDGAVLKDVFVYANAAAPDMLCKNCGQVIMYESRFVKGSQFDNCYILVLSNTNSSKFWGNNNAASADGAHASGHCAYVLSGMQEILFGHDLYITGNASCKVHDCYIDDVDADDTSILEFHGGTVDLLDAEGAVTVTTHGTHIKGNLVLAAGAGVVTLNGGEFMGTNAGAGSARLVHNLGNIGT